MALDREKELRACCPYEESHGIYAPDDGVNYDDAILNGCCNLHPPYLHPPYAVVAIKWSQLLHSALVLGSQCMAHNLAIDTTGELWPLIKC